MALGQLTTHLLTQKDERLSRPGWLTDSGRFTHVHVSGHLPAAGRARDGESSPVKGLMFLVNVQEKTRATCRLVEFDLSLKILRHVVAEVADAQLLKVLDLRQHGVGDSVGSTVHRLQIGLRHLCAGVFLRLRRHLLHLCHCRLQTAVIHAFYTMTPKDEARVILNILYSCKSVAMKFSI